VRKFLIVFGALALVAVVAAAVGIGVVAYRGNALDAESKAYIDGAVPAIAAAWNKQELLDRATPELKASVKPEELTAFFATLARLGPMVEYRGAKGDATMGYTTEFGSVTSASYTATVRCRNGSASFRIVLKKRDGHWMIHNLHVDPVAETPTVGKT